MQEIGYLKPGSMSAGKSENAFSVLAKLSFVVFLFAIFFGTSLPFREELADADRIGSSNIINQLVFTLLFLISLITLVNKRSEVLRFIRKEKFLTLFLAWCLLSVFWSDFSFTSFKRYFQILATVAVCLAVLLHVKSSGETLKYFRYILFLYVILSILSVFLIPGALDPKFHTWRGLAATKNNLAQAALVCILVWFYSAKSPGNSNKILAIMMMFLSLLLLLGTQSATSIATLGVLTIAGGITYFISDITNSSYFGKFYIAVIAFLLAAFFIVVFFLAPDWLLALPGYLGKDITFTGRTDLWQDVFAEAKTHLWLGCGFSAFWDVDSLSLALLYEDYVWLPNQAHLGYLDLSNETGIIGVTLFFLMVGWYFIHFLKTGKGNIWKWIFIVVLINNFTESSLFRPKHILGVMFIFSYIALFVDLMHENK